MSELSELMPREAVPTLIGRHAFEISPPNLLKWDRVGDVFVKMNVALPLAEILASVQSGEMSAMSRVSKVVDGILKANLGGAVHGAAKELLMTQDNVRAFTALNPDLQTAITAATKRASGRWVGNDMFGDFIDDNLTAHQAAHTIRTAADLTEASKVVGKFLPFLQTAPAQSEQETTAPAE